MPRKRKTKIVEVQGSVLPKGWKIEVVSDSGEYAIVRIPINDLDKIRIVKLPAAMRDYFRERQRKYRAKLKKNNGGR